MNVRSCCLFTRAEDEESSDMQIIVVYGTSCIKPSAYTRFTNICLNQAKSFMSLPDLKPELYHKSRCQFTDCCPKRISFPFFLSSESVSNESNEGTLLATFLVDLRGRNNIAHYARKALFGKLCWRKLFVISVLLKLRVVEAQNLFSIPKMRNCFDGTLKESFYLKWQHMINLNVN